MDIDGQQLFVIERANRNLEIVFEATGKVKDQSVTVFASSVALMSFVTVGEFSKSADSGWRTCFVCVSLLFGAALTGATVWLLRPTKALIPGTDDAEKIRDVYLDVASTDMVLQVVSDIAKCIADARESNERNGSCLRLMLLAFLGQVICVAVAMLMTMFV